MPSTSRCASRLIPSLSEGTGLVTRIARLYGWYRAIDRHLLRVPAEDGHHEDLDGFAALMLAAVDGLALQACLDPEGFDLDGAYRALERATLLFLEDCERGPKRESEPHSQP